MRSFISTFALLSLLVADAQAVERASTSPFFNVHTQGVSASEQGAAVSHRLQERKALAIDSRRRNDRRLNSRYRTPKQRNTATLERQLGVGETATEAKAGVATKVPSTQNAVTKAPKTRVVYTGDTDDSSLTTTLEFVMVRDEIGTDASSEGDIAVGSGIGMNGSIHDLTNTTSGLGFGSDPIGSFSAFCTVVSTKKGELLCSYEIYMDTDGGDGIGGLIVTGPIMSLNSTSEARSIVTGAEFDYATYTSGYLVTVQDATRPILFSYLTLTL
eukprot:Nitzschia sp. Nitz4//scaffold34_size148208//136011//136906//NITZ4_002997-RA/size148208-augustus-gene-0.191-mRNA-1//1//CDS//3329548846//1564//frame0